MSSDTILSVLPNISIRCYRKNDCDALAACGNNLAVAEYLSDAFPSPYTLNDAKSWIELQQNREPQTNFVIAKADSLIGGIGIELGRDVYYQSAELGYWLAEEFWGQGIVTHAVKAFTRWCFESFEIIRLHARVFENNLASKRVLEKSGFIYEGRQRKAVIKNGIIQDQFLYGRLSE